MNTCQKELEKNIIFISTIYDSFEALEETLGKLKLEKPLFITHVAKQAFAQEIFDHAVQNPGIHAPTKIKAESKQIFLH